MKYTIVIPAKNEELGLSRLLPSLACLDEITVIVVDDGSTDRTQAVCMKNGVQVLSHPYSMGNGAAIKTGLRAAETESVIFMDADGQHSVESVCVLIDAYEKGFDMVVGSRSSDGQANVYRGLGNAFYNWFAGKIVGHRVLDLTSGMRIVRRNKMLEFIHLLPNGFSYPSTITMAFFRAGYSVAYQEINVGARLGVSHLRLFRDGVRFLIIIFKIATLYSPLKVFVPVSLFHLLSGFIYYLYTYMTDHRFTNMGLLLFVAGVFIFLIGLVSEQITMVLYSLRYKSTDRPG